MNNEAQLKALCDDIYLLTRIKPVIYDASRHVVYAHPQSMCEFCRNIRKDPALRKLCLNSDQAGFDRCKISGDICVYRCHMGLTEAAAPILDQGNIIGYILFGQMLEESNRSYIISNINKINMPNKPQLLKELNFIPATDTKLIQASARLVSMCASYIQLRKLLMEKRKEISISVSEYIRQNLGTDLTISSICNHFTISRSTLYTVCKNAFNMGITEYIRACRLDKAIQLLQQSTEPVYKIAESVGIADANYFTKLIKQRTGLTPSQLRRQSR